MRAIFFMFVLALTTTDFEVHSDAAIMSAKSSHSVPDAATVRIALGKHS
jgi:hypothetical protein